MALNVTVNINDADEVILNKYTARYNVFHKLDPQTPSQLVRQEIRDWIRANEALLAEEAKIGLKAAYEKATLTEQTQIDAILQKYR